MTYHPSKEVYVPPQQPQKFAVPEMAPDRPLPSPTLANRVSAVMSPAYVPRKEIRSTMADVLEEMEYLEEDKKRRIQILNDRNDNIKIFGDNIAWLKSDLKGKDTIIASRNGAILAKDAIIADHVTEIASLKASISLEGKDATILSQTEVIASKEKTISKKDAIILTHVVKIANQRKEVHRLKESLARQNAHNETLLDRVCEHKEALLSANHKLEEMELKLKHADKNACDFEEIYRIKVQDFTVLQNKMGTDALQAVSGRVKHALDELKGSEDSETSSVKCVKLDGKAE